MHGVEGNTKVLKREKMVNVGTATSSRKYMEIFSIGFSDMTFFTSLELC